MTPFYSGMIIGIVIGLFVGVYILIILKEMGMFRRIPKAGDFVLISSDGGNKLYPVSRKVLMISQNKEYILVVGLTCTWIHRKFIEAYCDESVT